MLRYLDTHHDFESVPFNPSILYSTHFLKIVFNVIWKNRRKTPIYGTGFYMYNIKNNSLTFSHNKFY